MKKLPILAAIAMATVTILAFSSVTWGAPAYGSAEWYLNYMQQYSGNPGTPSQTTTPTPAPKPNPNPVPQPNPSPTYPANPGQNSNWYLDYLNQYQNVRPATPSPTIPKPTPTPNPKPNPDPNPPIEKPAGLTAEEQQLLAYINQERAKAGVGAVTLDPELVRVARIRADKLVETGTYEHNIPGLGTAGQHLRREGYAYSYVGENLAAAGSVYQAHANLVRSSGHRAIMLDSTYTKVGVGISHYSGNKSGVAVIEIFAK